MILYQFQHFDMEYNPKTTVVQTRFPDGTECSVWANEEDVKHSKLLGISPGEHKILHEICHNCLAIAEGQNYCPIVWNEAHKLPMPADAVIREQFIMALSYMVIEKPMEYADWWNRLQLVQAIANPYKIINAAKELFAGKSNELAVVKVII